MVAVSNIFVNQFDNFWTDRRQIISVIFSETYLRDAINHLLDQRRNHTIISC